MDILMRIQRQWREYCANHVTHPDVMLLGMYEAQLFRDAMQELNLYARQKYSGQRDIEYMGMLVCRLDRTNGIEFANRISWEELQ